MGCDKCGAPAPAGTSYQLTARGKLCPTCARASAPTTGTRCEACLQPTNPKDRASRIRLASDGRRRLCGYCLAGAERVARGRWRR